MDRRAVVDGGFDTPAHHETAPPPGSPATGSYAPRAEIPRFTSRPAADRPSRADAAPSHRDADGHWDPLVDPLPIDLEPLPAPDPVWTDDRAGASNGRLDAAFDDSTGASPGRGGRPDAGELTNGTTARRWRAADLLRARDSDAAAGDGTARRWRAADLLAGRDGTHGATDGASPTSRAADLVAGRDDAQGATDGASPTSRAADLLAGRDGTRGATDTASPTSRAADLLAGRDDTRAATDPASPKWRAADLLRGRGSQETGSGGRSRYEDAEDVDAAASGRANGRADTTEAGYGVPATRWRAADLLDGSEPAVGDRTRRRTTEPPERQQVNGHAEPRRRAAAPDDGPGDGATRWRAADLLDGGIDADRAPSPAAQRAAALHPGGGHGDRSDTSTWRAAELLDGGGSSDAATDPETTDASSRRRGAGRGGEAGGESRWRAASLLAGRGESGGVETAAADPWDTSTAHDRPTDGDTYGGDPPARRWRAADLLDGRSTQTGETARPRRRAPSPDFGPAAEDASAALPDAHTGRRRRGEPTAATPTGRRQVPTPPDTRPDRSAEDTPSRHGGDNRHAGTTSRVPPTQWAWPKEEPTPSPEPLPARRAAWSAADLLDEGKHAGGRRRAPESARHGKPTDDEAGRHYRP
jgi:hypothetical protein